MNILKNIVMHPMFFLWTWGLFGSIAAAFILVGGAFGITWLVVVGFISAFIVVGLTPTLFYGDEIREWMRDR